MTDIEHVGLTDVELGVVKALAWPETDDGSVPYALGTGDERG